jgi:hypothetical protein
MQFKLSWGVFILVFLFGFQKSDIARGQSHAETDLGISTKSSLQSVAYFPFMMAISFDSIDVRHKIGVRLTNFVGKNQKYQTANNLDRKKDGVDLVNIERSQHLSGNINVGFEAFIKNFNLGVGFAIDTIGYSNSPNVNFKGVQLDGSGLNVLRGSYNDFGSLYSETYLVKYFEKFQGGIKFGATHCVNQYRAKDSIPEIRSKRFLKFSDAIFVGIIYQLNLNNGS